MANHAHGALALEVLPDAAVSNALQCLKRRERPPTFPDQDLRRQRGTNGYLRVKLTFERPDRAPKVEMLANTANERMQDEVLDYISTYRLPCMSREQDSISVVQEFSFDALASPEGKPLRLTEGSAKPNACVVISRLAPNPPSRTLDRGTVSTVIQAVFNRAGDQPPEVKIIFSNSSKAIETMVMDYLAAYRMPCRVAGDKPYSFQQHFVFSPAGTVRAVFKDQQMPLSRFLSLMKNIEGEQAFFDLNSMACPFRLDWTVMQPALPNEVRQLGVYDANRAEFTAWLAGLQMDLTDRQAQRLIGSQLVIEVPCGVLELKKPVLPN